MRMLAHQGGWDELLVLAVPLLLATVLLLVANRRAARALARLEADDADDEPHRLVNVPDA